MKAQPWLPDIYLATRFVYGLRADYQLFVLRFTQVTVIAALRLATIYEESLGEYDLGKQAIVEFDSPDLDFTSPTISELGNFIHDNLDQIMHTTSVESCYHQFETLKSFMSAAKPWLPESYFADRFLYCLQNDFQRFLIRFHPTTVKAAYRLAAIYEESIYLKYFPESVTCGENISSGTRMGGNQVEDTTQRLLSAQSVCKDSVVKDDFHELVIAIDDTCAHKKKESATLYHNQDILKTMELVTYHGKDSVAFNVSFQKFSAGMVIPLDSQMAYVQLKAVSDVQEDADPGWQSPSIDDTCNNVMAMLTLNDLKVHPPEIAVPPLHPWCTLDNPWLSHISPVHDRWLSECVLMSHKISHQSILLIIGCPWRNYCLSHYLGTNESLARCYSYSVYEKTVRGVIVEEGHLQFLCELGPRYLQWQSDQLEGLQNGSMWSNPAGFLYYDHSLTYTSTEAHSLGDYLGLQDHPGIGLSISQFSRAVIQMVIPSIMFFSEVKIIKFLGYNDHTVKTDFAFFELPDASANAVVVLPSFSRLIHLCTTFLIADFLFPDDKSAGSCIRRSSFFDILKNSYVHLQQVLRYEFDVESIWQGKSWTKLSWATSNLEVQGMVESLDTCVQLEASYVRSVCEQLSLSMNKFMGSFYIMCCSAFCVGTTICFYCDIVEQKYKLSVKEKAQSSSMSIHDVVEEKRELRVKVKAESSNSSETRRTVHSNRLNVTCYVFAPRSLTFSWEPISLMHIVWSCAAVFFRLGCDKRNLETMRTVPACTVSIAMLFEYWNTLTGFRNTKNRVGRPELGVAVLNTSSVYWKMLVLHFQLEVQLISCDKTRATLWGTNDLKGNGVTLSLYECVELVDFLPLLVKFPIRNTHIVFPYQALQWRSQDGGVLTTSVCILPLELPTFGFHGALKMEVSKLQHGHIALPSHFSTTQYKLQLWHKYRLASALSDWDCLVYLVSNIFLDFGIVLFVSPMDSDNGVRLFSFWRLRSKFPGSDEMSMKPDITSTCFRVPVFTTRFLSTYSSVPSLEFTARGTWLFDPGICCKLLVDLQLSGRVHAIQFAHFNTSKWIQFFLALSIWLDNARYVWLSNVRDNKDLTSLLGFVIKILLMLATSWHLATMCAQRANMVHFLRQIAWISTHDLDGSIESFHGSDKGWMFFGVMHGHGSSLVVFYVILADKKPFKGKGMS